MLKERAEFIKTLIYVSDLILVSLTYFGVYYFVKNLYVAHAADWVPDWHVVKKPHSIDLYLQPFWCALLLWAVLLRARGEYVHLRIQTYHATVSRLFLTGILFFALFAGVAFILRFDFLSRFFMAAYTAVTVLGLILSRFVVLSVAYHARRRGYNYRNLLLVGTGRRAQEFMSLVAKHREWGYRIVGLLDREASKKDRRVAGYPVIGVLEDMPDLLDRHVIDEVVFVVPRNWIGEIEKCIIYCEAVGIPATLATDFFDLDIASGVPKELDGYTYLTFETRLLKAWELFIKRIFDIVFSSTLILLSSPVLFMTALGIKLTSSGPVFFKQVRCGRNGRTFLLYKFRSMVADAEERLAELRDKNEMSGPVFKMQNDPRLTRIGPFLRKTSLDEFPQLWNVLKGDMSLVGPRPPIPEEVEQYEPWQRRRLSMNPGITCIWQVSGRNEIDFENWMKLDLQYIDKWSLWLDFKILLLTVKAVLSRRGAR